MEEKTYKGRVYVKTQYTPVKWVLRSRFMMEQKMGRVLLSSEHVHHINENTEDDSIENLQLLTKAEHTSIHRKGKKASQETCIKIGIAMQGHTFNRGRKHSEESRKNMSLAHIGIRNCVGQKYTEERKKNMSLGHKGQIPWNLGKKHSEEAKRKMSLSAKNRKRNGQ